MYDLASFMNAFPYLVSALIMLALFLAALGLFPTQRRPIVLSALLATPWGFWGLALVPSYWTPNLLVRMGRVGVEDFIWGFATGGLIWVLGVCPSGRRFTFCLHPGKVARRYLIVSLVGAAVFVPLWLGGVKVMPTFLLSLATLGVFLLCLCREQTSLAVWGAVGFAGLNAVVMKVVVVACPDYYSQMTPGNLSGINLWDLPVEEWAWSFATGAVWPLAMCYVLDAQDESRAAAIQEG